MIFGKSIKNCIILDKTNFVKKKMFKKGEYYPQRNSSLFSHFIEIKEGE